MTDIKQVASNIVYKNKWMTVREDKVVRASGAEGIYGVVEKPHFVVIAPIQDRHITLVEQYRYPVQARFWELPQGSWEGSPEADPAALAAGELREETGLIANTMTYVGFQYPCYGYANQGFHIYLAGDLQQSSATPDAEEEDLISKRFTLDEFEHMLVSGQIKDATTVCAYGLLKLKGLA